jgi:hypothetical protein
MLKTTYPLANILFVVNHALGNVVFLYFLHYTGRWIGEDWFFMAFGGVIAGTLARIAEHWLYRRFECVQHRRWLSFICIIALSILFITMGFSIGYLGEGIRYQLTVGSRITFANLVFAAFMSLICLPLIIPFGVVVGLINGALLQMVRILRRADKPV